MTEEEQEKVVRSIKRTCRGPLAPESRALVSEALAKGDEETAKGIDETHREPCGADFNDVIMENPLDGEVHGYECPKCGVTGSYRAPKFP